MIDVAEFQGTRWERGTLDDDERGPIRIFYMSYHGHYFEDFHDLHDARLFWYGHLLPGLPDIDGGYRSIADGAFVAMVNSETGEEFPEPEELDEICDALESR